MSGLMVVVLCAAAPLAAAVAPQDVQLGAVDVWPRDWFTDLPSVDLTGIWRFDAAASDPMLEVWADRDVRYEISQQAAFAVLDFQVPGMASNVQSYRWDGSVERFERGGRMVEEAARWTEAGRMLEVIGRHWDPETPEDKVEYRFTYVARGDVLTFVQEDASGRTVWRFQRDR